jgi:hypothetical protein
MQLKAPDGRCKSGVYVCVFDMTNKMWLEESLIESASFHVNGTSPKSIAKINYLLRNGNKSDLFDART